MKEETLRMVAAIGFLMQVIGFIGLGLIYQLHVTHASHMRDQMIIEFGEAFKERDQRLFQLNGRVQTLEEQRDLERRVTALEKAARTYCTGSKTEMCGTLEVLR